MLPDYISGNAVNIVAIVALGIAIVAWSGAGGRFVGCLKGILPANGLAGLPMVQGSYLRASSGGGVEYGQSLPVIVNQQPPVVVVPPAGYPPYYLPQPPEVHQHFHAAPHQQAPPAPHNPPAAAPAAAPVAAAAPAAVPTPTVGQTGAAGSPVVISGGAPDLFVRWRKHPGGWTGWYTVATLPGGVLTLNVGGEVAAADVICAQFARGTDTGAESAYWTVA